MSTPTYRGIEIPRTTHRRLAAMKARLDVRTLWQAIDVALEVLEEKLDRALLPSDRPQPTRDAQHLW